MRGRGPSGNELGFDRNEFGCVTNVPWQIPPRCDGSWSVSSVFDAPAMRRKGRSELPSITSNVADWNA